jgi:glycosyltransferase involved in cell wall biosynthesis
METPVVKVDLHIHSKYSRRPSEWMLQKIGCAESYSEPEALYRSLLAKGMSFVTLTDHNTIDGGLEIAHFPRTFLSEEVTTYFPDDRCKIHLLVFDISEKQHRDIQHFRENVFDLTRYLNQQGILHALAHPFFSVNDKMDLERFEKCLILFKNFELNGSRGKEQNLILKTVLESLTPELLCRLMNRHDISSPLVEPWKKGLTGGSDDHSFLTIGRQYTEVRGARTLHQFLCGLSEGQGQPAGHFSDPQDLALTIYSIAYQFHRKKFSRSTLVLKDPMVRFLHEFLGPEPEKGGRLHAFSGLWPLKWKEKDRPPTDIQEYIRWEVQRLLAKDAEWLERTRKGMEGEKGAAEKWFVFVNQVSERAFVHLGNRFLDHLTRGRFFNLFQSLGSGGALYALLSPYVIAYANFATTRQLSQKVKRRFLGEDSKREARGCSAKIAHFTDTFEEINGVALSLRRQAELAQKNGKSLTIITCGKEENCRAPGLRIFEAIGCYPLPEYEDLKLFFPPFLKILSYCYGERFTAVHSATPGPLGLAALGVARILKIPVVGTYHTELPEYARYLTDDPLLEEWCWKYMIWYYRQLDKVYVPSREIQDMLTAKGLPEEKISLYYRGVDLNRFHPEKRNGIWQDRYGLPDGINLLYVGRISKEKNLLILDKVLSRLTETATPIHLIFVGDGPLLGTLREKMQGLPCLFTGYLTGEELAQAYASSDLFLFPSKTDTFGNVVLEAQASGLPVIVTEAGGPKENILPGKSGLVVNGDDPEEWIRVIRELVADSDRLKEMGRAARDFMESYSQETAFLKTWELYEKETEGLQG